MNMKHYIYTLLLTLLLAAGCSKEDFPGIEDNNPPQGRIFTIRANNLPTVSLSRAVGQEELPNCWTTAFNHSDMNTEKPFPPYFEDEEFDMEVVEDPVTHKPVKRFSPVHSIRCQAPQEGGKFEFFAWYPSLSGMKEVTGENYFQLGNQSSRGKALNINYSIVDFRVDKDVVNQVDFMTARSSSFVEVPAIQEVDVDEDGNFTVGDEHQEISVELNFEHQLCEIRLLAWSQNEKYKFEIAGMKLGNPAVEADFKYNTISTSKGTGPAFVGSWVENSKVRGNVESLFQPGNKLVVLDGVNAASKDKAVSIMGQSTVLGHDRFAMVIPANNQKWEGRKDPKIEQTPYTTTKSYFSVLLRVSHKKYGSKIVYPYPIYDKPMRVIYLAVKANNEIICQVYPDSEGRRFYTDEARTQLYTLPAGCEIKDFGWAAIPVEVKWEPGKLYIYKLNYSNGIGLHDPADPDPGTPIVEKNTLGVSLDVIVADWGDYTDETIKVIPDE